MIDDEIAKWGGLGNQPSVFTSGPERWAGVGRVKAWGVPALQNSTQPAPIRRDPLIKRNGMTNWTQTMAHRLQRPSTPLLQPRPSQNMPLGEDLE